MLYAHLIDAIWLLQPVLQSAALAAIWRRYALKRHLTFSLYLLLEILQFCVLFPLRTGSYRVYFAAYWTGNAVLALATVIVLAAVYRDTLARISAVKENGRRYFRLFVAGALVVALGSSVIAHPTEKWWVLGAILGLEQAIRVFQLLLLMTLIGGAVLFGMSLRTLTFGIALGFGLYAGIGLVGLAIRNATSYAAAGRMYALVNTAAYTFACAIWLWFACVKEPDAATIAPGMRDELESWRESMSGMRRK
jgi:hypothetical protein